MSVPQQLTWDGADGPAAAKGGQLVYGPLAERPSQDAGAPPKISLYGPGGEAYVTQGTATIEGPATIPTLAQAGLRGQGATVDAPLRLTSTTGLQSRMPLLVGTGAAGRPQEVVRVRTVLDAAGLVLFGPLLHDHEVGALVGGCRLLATIASTGVPTRFRKGRAMFEWGAEGSASRNRAEQIAVDVVRYPLRRLATQDDMRRVDAAFYSDISKHRDPEEILDEGWDECRRQVWRRQIWGLVTSEALRWPTVLFAAWLETMGWGQRWAERAAMWKAEAQRVLEDSIESTPVDPNEDGQVGEREQPIFSTIALSRAS